MFLKSALAHSTCIQNIFVVLKKFLVTNNNLFLLKKNLVTGGGLKIIEEVNFKA